MTIDYQEQQIIEKQLGTIIDSSWHYSWYWELGPYGHYSLEGWKQALADGERLLQSREAAAQSLREFLPRVRRVVEELQATEDSMADDEETTTAHVGNGHSAEGATP